MISEFFINDHREIDAQLTSATDGAGLTPQSLESIRTMAEQLERHIRWEEEILFPAAEEKNPDLAHGPGHVMRMEHEQIRAYLADLRESVAKSDGAGNAPPGIRETLHAVADLLGEHNAKEEAVYYPICDQLLSDEEAQQLLSQLRDMH